MTKLPELFIKKEFIVRQIAAMFSLAHEAEYKNPSVAAIEEYLDYVFERLPGKKDEFDRLKKGGIS